MKLGVQRGVPTQDADVTVAPPVTNKGVFWSRVLKSELLKSWQPLFGIFFHGYISCSRPKYLLKTVDRLGHFSV
jgi:hypothetical protein